MAAQLPKGIKKNIRVGNDPLRMFFWLDYLDSNQDKQNQNLLCCHYTIVQSFGAISRKRCKISVFSANSQILCLFFYLAISKK